MQAREALRIGCVKYLNARPLICGWLGEVEFDHPSVLCQRLARRELDVALVSSFEFLRNPIYQIVDDVAIASAGKVYSVFVAWVGEARPSKIEVDPASTTGVALLQYLMAARGEKLSAVDPPEERLSPLQTKRGRLLIGDQAIRFRQKFGDAYKYWDLGEEWQKNFDLPFVYALWLIRPEVLDAKSVAQELRAVRDKNLARLEEVTAAEKEFDRDFCKFYYQECLHFRFGEKEKEGLRTFQQLCAKHGLLPKRDVEFAMV